MQPKGKLPETFVMELVGEPSLRPWNVPTRQRNRIEDAIASLIEHREIPEADELEEGYEEEAAAAPSPIYWLASRSGSAVYSYAAVDARAAMETLRAYGDNLRNPSRAHWDGPSLSTTRNISAAAKAIGCKVVIREPRNHGNVIATIAPEAYADISKTAFVTINSSVYGRLERVGGSTRPRCSLRIARQPRMVFCSLKDEAMATALGPHVYHVVRVAGRITRFRQSGHVKTIAIEQFWPTRKERSAREALHAIWAAGGKAWDEIDDVEAAIKEGR